MGQQTEGRCDLSVVVWAHWMAATVGFGRVADPHSHKIPTRHSASPSTFTLHLIVKMAAWGPAGNIRPGIIARHLGLEYLEDHELGECTTSAPALAVGARKIVNQCAT